MINNRKCCLFYKYEYFHKLKLCNHSPCPMVVTAIVYGGIFAFAVATIWWIMSFWVFWLTRFDVNWWNPIDFLTYHSCFLRHWIGCPVIRVSFWRRHSWWKSLIFPGVYPCLIIGYLSLYLRLAGSRYPNLFVVIIILHRIALILQGLHSVMAERIVTRNSLSIAVFLCNYCFIRIFLLHMCAHVVGSCEYASTGWLFNVTFSI